MSRCPNCMNELVHDRCTGCGYPAVEVAVIRGAMPPDTVLMDRFELGYALGASHQSIAYIAYDRLQGKAVLVLEFFPKQISMRKKLQVSPRSHNELYMDACRLYLTSEQAMPMRLIHTFADNNTAYRVYQLNGSAANAVDEADQMLDRPFLFRNAEGKPIMAVNALPIPAMPQTTPWSLSRKLTKERTRKKVNGIAAVALAGVIAVAGGFVYMDMTREYPVTIRVKTDSPIVEAKLGDEVLPDVTPDPDGYVVYTQSLRKGEYPFRAKNAEKEKADTLKVTGAEDAAFEVAIPTPDPKAYTAEEADWYFRKDGKTSIVKDGQLVEVDELRLAATKPELYEFRVEAEPVDGMKLALVRDDGFEQELEMSAAGTTFSVTEGVYSLYLYKDGERIAEPSIHIPGKETVKQFDTRAYQVYHDFLKDRAPEELYYIGDACSIEGLDVPFAEINKWAEDLPELFGQFEQHDVYIALDNGVPADAQVALNGIAWQPGDPITVSKTGTELDYSISVGGTEWDAGRIAANNESVSLGGTKATEDISSWDSITGLAEHNGEHYWIGQEGRMQKMTEERWQELQSDMALYPSLRERLDKPLLSPVMKVNSSVNLAVVDRVRLEGIDLTQIAPGTYQFDALPGGDYDVEVCLKGGDRVRENLDIKSSGEYELMTSDAREMKVIAELIGSRKPMLMETSGGYQYLGVEEDYLYKVPTQDGIIDKTLTPGVLLAFADRYESIMSALPLYDVQLSVDQRINPRLIRAVYINGTEVGFNQETYRLDVRKLSAGDYTIEYELDDGKTAAPHTLKVAGIVRDDTLLKAEADVAFKALRYWGSAQDVQKINGNSAGWLTREAQNARQDDIVLLSLQVNPENWGGLTFILETDDAEYPLELKPDENGMMDVMVTRDDEAQYRLCVQNPEKLMDIRPLRTLTMDKNNMLSLADMDKDLLAVAADLGENMAVINLPVDSRLAADISVYAELKDATGEEHLMDLEKVTDEQGAIIYTAGDETVAYGDYLVMVIIDNSANSAVYHASYCYVASMYEDGTMKLMTADAAPREVSALLEDVADRAVADLRFFGNDRKDLAVLAGERRMLGAEAFQAEQNAVQEYKLFFPNVSPSTDLLFELRPAGDNTNVIKIDVKTYRKAGFEKGLRYESLFLSEGTYELTVRKTGSSKVYKMGTIIIGDELEVKSSTGVLTTDKNKPFAITIVEEFWHEDMLNMKEFAGGGSGGNAGNDDDNVAGTPTTAPVVTPKPTDKPTQPGEPTQIPEGGTMKTPQPTKAPETPQVPIVTPVPTAAPPTAAPPTAVPTGGGNGPAPTQGVG